jgi:hypothetical protein
VKLKEKSLYTSYIPFLHMKDHINKIAAGIKSKVSMQITHSAQLSKSLFVICYMPHDLRHDLAAKQMEQIGHCAMLDI